MQHVRILVFSTFAIATVVSAQTSQRPLPPSMHQQQQQSSQPQQQNFAPANDIAGILAQIDQTSQATNVDLAQLRIEKWKTDGDVKQQMRSNAQSLERNLSAALPSLVTQARTSPGDLTTLFRLYRNLGAVYDVLANVAEATGAFGSKEEYQALASHVDQFDAARRGLGDAIESAAQRQSAEIVALRNAASTVRQAALPPKKIIVDDAAPSPAKKKTARKKKAPATKPPATSSAPQ